MTRGLPAGDVFRLRLVADPRLSPDGRYLAYLRAGLDRAADTTTEQVVLADLGTGGEKLLARIHNARCPRWSADGRLAFACDADGTMRLLLWAPGDRLPHRPEAGDGTPGTSGTAPVIDLDWSPDGRKIALTRAGESGPGIQVVTVAKEPGRADQEPWHVPSDRGAAWFPRWSPDSGRLAFLSGPGSRLHIAGYRDAGSRPGPEHGPVLAFAWAPTGDEIAFLAPRTPDEADLDCRLYRWRVDGAREPGTAGTAGELSEVAADWDRSLGSTVRSDDARGTGPPALSWSAATGRIYFTVADGGRGRIGWADPADGSHGYLTGGDRTCLDPSLDRDGLVIAFVSTSPAEPGEVHLAAADGTGSEERRVTDANPWLDRASLAPARPIETKAPDGTPVEGWITAARDQGEAGELPLVVSVHGGPHYPAGWRFSLEAQRLAARGYAVLTANPVGSGGYGRRFAAAVRGAWGTADWAAIDRLVDAAIAMPDIDGDRVAITGVSYGGYLAMRSITLSSRFRAAISENGISNLLAQWAAEPGGGTWLAAEMGGPPWVCPEVYVASSPVTAADRITTPLLLVHGEFDTNCPIGQSEQMLAALRSLGRDVALVVIEGEGHLMNLEARPSRRLARAQAVDAWLDRYLGEELL